MILLNLYVKDSLRWTTMGTATVKCEEFIEGLISILQMTFGVPDFGRFSWRISVSPTIPEDNPYAISIIVEMDQTPELLATLDERHQAAIAQLVRLLPLQIKGELWIRLCPGKCGAFQGERF